MSSYLVQEVDGTSRFTLEDGSGSLLLESGLTPPVNTVAPVVSGAAPVGSTLSTTTGTWTDDGAPTFGYQWTRNGSDIGGATAATYATQAADVGAAIGSKVTDTDTGGAVPASSSNTITVTSGGGGGGGGATVGWNGGFQAGFTG